MFAMWYVGHMYSIELIQIDICPDHALLNEGVFQEFEADFAEFDSKMKDTDQRLGAIFCQAFDDALGLNHAFKVRNRCCSFWWLRLHNNSTCLE